MRVLSLLALSGRNPSYIHVYISCRLKAIRANIEDLESRHVEDTANEYNFKVFELEKSASAALERLDSLKDENPQSPTLEEAKESYRRASSDALESKSVGNSAKSDLNTLKRLRKDERQLLSSIFAADEEWKRQPEVSGLYDSIHQLQGSLAQAQQVVANIKSASRLLEIASGNLSEGAMASAQERMKSAVELFPELKRAMGGELTPGVIGTAHQMVVQALTQAEQERIQQQFELNETSSALLDIQRRLVLG